jgi:hypothetical protein
VFKSTPEDINSELAMLSPEIESKVNQSEIHGLLQNTLEYMNDRENWGRILDSGGEPVDSENIGVLNDNFGDEELCEESEYGESNDVFGGGLGDNAFVEDSEGEPEHTESNDEFSGDLGSD